MATSDGEPPIITDAEATAPDSEAKAPETAELFVTGKAAATMYETQKATVSNLLDHKLSQATHFERQEPIGPTHKYKTREAVAEEACFRRIGAYNDATRALYTNATPVVSALISLKQRQTELDAAARRQIGDLLANLRNQERDESRRRSEGSVDDNVRVMRAGDKYDSYVRIYGDMASFFVRYQQ